MKHLIDFAHVVARDVLQSIYVKIYHRCATRGLTETYRRGFTLYKRLKELNQQTAR